MSKIIIKDLSKDTKISKEEMRQVLGGINRDFIDYNNEQDKLIFNHSFLPDKFFKRNDNILSK